MDWFSIWTLQIKFIDWLWTIFSAKKKTDFHTILFFTMTFLIYSALLWIRLNHFFPTQKIYSFKIVTIFRFKRYNWFSLLISKIKMVETFVCWILKVLFFFFVISFMLSNPKLTVFHDFDCQQNGNGSSHIHSKCSNSIRPSDG